MEAFEPKIGNPTLLSTELERKLQSAPLGHCLLETTKFETKLSFSGVLRLFLLGTRFLQPSTLRFFFPHKGEYVFTTCRIVAWSSSHMTLLSSNIVDFVLKNQKKLKRNDQSILCSILRFRCVTKAERCCFCCWSVLPRRCRGRCWNYFISLRTSAARGPPPRHSYPSALCFRLVELFLVFAALDPTTAHTHKVGEGRFTTDENRAHPRSCWMMIPVGRAQHEV